MDDPKNVLITGLRESTVDMNCGPQKRAMVSIQYEPPAMAVGDVKGIVRAIHYEPEAGNLK